MPAGRPSDYKPEYCARAIAAGKRGKSRAWIAAEFETTRQTLAAWEQAHPEFLVAMDEARGLSQRWWEDAGQKGLEKQPFNAAIWSRSMAARFPDDWRENSKLEVQGGLQVIIAKDDAKVL